MGKTHKPIVTSDTVVEEVSKRTGLSFNLTHKIIYTYFDVLKECLFKGVMTRIGTLGTLYCHVMKPQKNRVYHTIEKNYTKLPAQDRPGFHTPYFKPSRALKLELKEATQFWDDTEQETEKEKENDTDQ